MATVRLQLRRGTSSEWTAANPQLAAGEIGIETDTNTFKFGDGSTLWNSLDYALSSTVDDYVPTNLLAVANGVATLDASGYIPTAQLPPLAKITVQSAANQAARLALTAEPGDIVIQSDTGTTYVLSSSPASTNGNWREISATAAISAAISTHEADTTSVHGIADTSLLATTANVATAKSEAISAAASASGTALSTHEADTTNIHGIADTSALATKTYVDTADELKATLLSPTFTGVPAAPTASLGTNTTQLATTAFVKSEVDALIAAAPNALNTLNELAAAIGNDANYATTVTNALADKVSQSGARAAISGGSGITYDNTTGVVAVNTSIATKTYVDAADTTLTNAVALKAPIDAPTFTGTVTLPLTTNIGDVSSTEIAYVNGVTSSIQGQIDTKLASADASSTYAPKASPTFTGTVTLPSTTIIGDISTAELAYLANVTSDVQTQIDSKISTTSAASLYAPKADPTFTGTVTLPSTTIIGDVSTLELGYINGVTSGIQGQIDAKAPLASPTFTGTVTLPIGTVTSAMILDGAVGEAEISGSAVTTAKIADASVTTAKLADNVITSGKIADGAIVNADINATAAIDWTKLAIASTVDSTEIGYVNGVTSAIQGQIDAKLASATAATTYAPLASPTFTGTVTLPLGTVTSSMIVDGTITTGDVADVAITTAKIADGAITTAKLGDDSVTSAKIVAGTIVNSDINSAAAIDWTKLAISSTVSATELGYVNGVTSAIQGQIDAKLASATAATTYAPLASPTFTGTVTLPANTISQSHLSDDSVGTNEIGGLAVTTAKIADGAVTTAKLGDDSVTSAKIVAGTIVNSDINSAAAIDWTKLAISSTVSATELGYVDGVTSAIQTQIDAKLASATASSTYAPLASPALTGTPTAPLAATGTNTTQVATTSFVQQELNTLTTGAPAAMNTLDELAAALGDDANYAATITTALSAKAPLASPTFTGTVTVAASGVAFTDGTQTKAGVPSLTTIGTAIGAAYNLSTGGLTLRDQLIPISGTWAVTVPANATTAFPIGTSIDFYQSAGTGGNFVEAVGVTILRTPGLKLRTTYSSATLTKVATDTWLLAGDLSA